MMSNLSYVLRPATRYVEIGDRLSAAGWSELDGATSLAPLLPGEPEHARWMRDEKAELIYSFNPALDFRVVEIVRGGGEVFAELAEILPVASVREILMDLESDDVRRLLRALLAVAEIRLAAAFPRVLRLTQHGDERVAGAAQRARRMLAEEIGESASRFIRERRKQRPGRSVLFELSGPPDMRRQVLRWMARESLPSKPEVADGLRSGLEDPDWEVRVTAMLAAARIGVSEIAKPVRRVALPKSTRVGLDRGELRLLRVLRRLCLGLLAGRMSRTETFTDHADAELIEHMRRCVVGQPPELHDRVALFIVSFLLPLEYPNWAPDPPPEGIEIGPDGFKLTQTGHEVLWVPPMQHWLGDDSEDSTEGVANPVRWIEPAGYFMLADPTVLGEPCTLDEALARCEALAATERLPVRLPTADEREMALRGPDARLYPWGNGLLSRSSGVEAISPWGFEVPDPMVGDWAVDDGRALVCGGGKAPRCAHRAVPGDPGARHWVRPFISPQD